MRELLLPLCPLILLVAAGCGNRQSTENVTSVNPEFFPRVMNGPAEISEERALAVTKLGLAGGASPHDIIDREYGLTRLHVAARNGHAKLLEYLIDQGGDVNIENKHGEDIGGETPLHWASTAEVVDRLIARGADPKSPGSVGQSPPASMAVRKRLSALDEMINHGADVNARDMWFGNSVLHFAPTALVEVDLDNPAENRREDLMTIIEHLVANGAKINAQDNFGETPLHTAAKYDARFVALLLRLGADPSLKDKEGKRPIDWSEELGQEEATTLLEKAMKQ